MVRLHSQGCSNPVISLVVFICDDVALRKRSVRSGYSMYDAAVDRALVRLNWTERSLDQSLISLRVSRVVTTRLGTRS